MDFSTIINVFKFEHLFLTYVIISFFNPYISKRSNNFFANVVLLCQLIQIDQELHVLASNKIPKKHI